jgi:hypothetical protein
MSTTRATFVLYFHSPVPKVSLSSRNSARVSPAERLPLLLRAGQSPTLPFSASVRTRRETRINSSLPPLRVQ